jgi:Holliday junction resolvase RusA-like endonuclease
LTVLAFVVPGPPVPKGRPRFGKGFSYTPKRTRDYERTVRLCAQAAVSAARWSPDEGAYQVEIRVYRAANRGDLDNFCKAATDPLNGLVWPDDRLVTSLAATMHVDRERPRLEVRVTKASSAPPTPPYHSA